MGIESADGGSGNGNGHVPFEEATVWVEGEGPLHDAVGRLVTVLVSEAVKRRCSEILVDVGENGCPVHFVRGSEKLEMDALPVRLFAPLKERAARMCGTGAGQREGMFTMPLKGSKTSAVVYGEVSVSVVFADSSLRFTIAGYATELAGILAVSVAVLPEVLPLLWNAAHKSAAISSASDST